MIMRKFFQLSFSLLALTLSVSVADLAWAQARKTTVNCNVDSDGNVTVSHSISGVGNEDLCVVSSTTFVANCACQNNGGNCPTDAKKQTSPIPTQDSDVEEPRNGQIKGTQFLAAPGDGICDARLGCPNGQDGILASLGVGFVGVEVFATFTPITDPVTGDVIGCTPSGDPVRSGACTPPPPQTFTFDPECAELF